MGGGLVLVTSFTKNPNLNYLGGVCGGGGGGWSM